MSQLMQLAITDQQVSDGYNVLARTLIVPIIGFKSVNESRSYNLALPLIPCEEGVEDAGTQIYAELRLPELKLVVDWYEDGEMISVCIQVSSAKVVDSYPDLLGGV